MEHVAGSQNRLPLVIHLPCRPLQIAISANDLLCLRIPDDELLVAVLAGVELIYIHWFASASSRLTEGDLTQTADLLHDVGSIMSRHDVNLIVTLVGHAKLPLGRQLTLQNFLGNGLDDLLFHYDWDFRVLVMI